MKRFLLFTVDRKLLSGLSLAFVLSTIAGTISHELGHYIMARSLGYSPRIGYDYTRWGSKRDGPSEGDNIPGHSKRLNLKSVSQEKTEFEPVQKKPGNDAFWITLAGPVQTMLTGTLGFLLLLRQRRNITASGRINIFQWLCVFLSLFWLRPFVNFIRWVVEYFFSGRWSVKGDEVKLAVYFGLPNEVFVIATGLIGLAVALFVIFRIVPIDKRGTFILAGVLGGILGYLFWLVWVGPLLLP